MAVSPAKLPTWVMRAYRDLPAERIWFVLALRREFLGVTMSEFLLLVGMSFLAAGPLAGDRLPQPLVTGLKNPESVAVGSDGRIYISEIGEFGKDGDGRVLVVDKTGKAVPFATGLDDPKGMVFAQKGLFVADNKRVWRIDEKGKATVFAAKEAFPREPLFLNDIAADEQGVLYVSDSGDLKGNGGAVFRIDLKGKVRLVADARTIPGLKVPNGLVLDGLSHLLLLDFGTGNLLRIRIADGSSVKVADGFDGGDGLAWDWFGQLFITSWPQGKVWGIARPGQKPVLVASGFQSAADLCLDPTGQFMLVPDMKAGTITALPTAIPGNEVDARPLPLRAVPAFPKLKWTGWEGFAADGKVRELRPVFLTHAGDGSQRNFVTLQQGIIHVFSNDPEVQKTKIFLDIQKKVFYADKENEQGLLGLAFHPHYKENGEFFVFYTLRQPKLTNILARFRVSKADPDRADPDSEEELLRIPRPFWNHDGGTICFGPDGYLYVALGDGGSANDPNKNGQNLNTLLAKILRIDVDRRADGKKYGIPRDNPFVGKPGAAPEIWAYGLRNPWRMAFDRQTGRLWAADVGQNLYEEIDIIVKGGNYGWSLREGLHPFGVKGSGPRKDLIEPIWEYHHDIGKSMTGGVVYRGKRLPELVGSYLYGDYITGRIWALRYDDAKKRVIANRPLHRTKELIFSFAEDEQGEVYFLAPTLSGQGILRFERILSKRD
jgi:glucose/arabinose dehydrogenase